MLNLTAKQNRYICFVVVVEDTGNLDPDSVLGQTCLLKFTVGKSNKNVIGKMDLKLGPANFELRRSGYLFC